MPQKTNQLVLSLEGRGEAPPDEQSAEASTVTTGHERPGASDLFDRVLERPNLQAALKRVRQNKGSPGIDGMTVDELGDYLRAHWPEIREALQSERYRPQPVKRQLIPKPGGGERELGIPTVLDRFIQQALLQVLQPIIDPTFSAQSYGFRPGRNAHQAVVQARGYIREGRGWVVDVDLEKFFDRVNHDVLMSRLARRIVDTRVLRLVRRYLESGIMANGVVIERQAGTPQGGPLSPLLANVLLDEVDKALELRGHAFVRYADDCNVYVRSERAGARVMATLRKLYARLRLKVNETKSAVGQVWGRKFLGFTFWRAPKEEVRVAVAAKAIAAFKERVRELTRRSCGKSLAAVAERLRAYVLGWKAYFGLGRARSTFETLDGWIRHRLRALQLKHWRRGTTIFRELRARGMSQDGAARVAGNARRWWRNSAMLLNVALPNRYFDQLGLPRLAA